MWDSGEFFCDIPKIIREFKLQSVPVFVGALYYISKGDVSSKIFKRARELKTQYDELGFIRLRGKENEEPLLAVSMAIYDQKPIVDDGTIKADAMAFSSMNTNILNNSAILNNNSLSFPTWSKIKYSTPLIVHYNAHYTNTYHYKAEVLRLKLYSYLKNKYLVQFFTNLLYYFPLAFVTRSKTFIRPLYAKLFGNRKILKSNRI